jgi:hypothetical protein
MKFGIVLDSQSIVRTSKPRSAYRMRISCEPPRWHLRKQAGRRAASLAMITLTRSAARPASSFISVDAAICWLLPVRPAGPSAALIRLRRALCQNKP